MTGGDRGDDEVLARAAETHAAVRAHYLSLPGRSVEGWAAVAGDPRKFNRTWRHRLRRFGHDCPDAEDPPPARFRAASPGNLLPEKREERS